MYNIYTCTEKNMWIILWDAFINTYFEIFWLLLPAIVIKIKRLVIITNIVKEQILRLVQPIKSYGTYYQIVSW